MRQPDSQEAPPKNQNREMNSASDEITEEIQTALELTEELCEELRDSRRLSLLYPGTSTAPENGRPRTNQETTRQSPPPSSPRFGF